MTAHADRAAPPDAWAAPPPTPLSPESRRAVVRLARAAVAGALEGHRIALDPRDLPSELRAEAAVFVTIHHGGELRACIGRLDPGAALAENLVAAAISAATSDPRFDPIRASELPELELEVSVLGPLTPLPDVAAFDPLEMGIVIGRGARRGLLLPQVARERGWDARTTLEAVCWKAGLPDDAWRRPGSSLEVFTATVIEEAAVAS